jgi:hypothetical protein
LAAINIYASGLPYERSNLYKDIAWKPQVTPISTSKSQQEQYQQTPWYKHTMSELQYYRYKGWGEVAHKKSNYNQLVRVGDRLECSGQGTLRSPSPPSNNLYQ